MREWIIIRHGSNAANQRMTDALALGVVGAETEEHARKMAAVHTVYANQWIEIIPYDGADDDIQLEAEEANFWGPS